MSNKSDMFTGAAIVVFVISAIATTLSLPTGNGVRINDLVYLGTVDGKSYFHDRAEIRNWTDAGKVCEESGMNLATISSPEQASFLQTMYGTLGSVSWVVGRESQTLSRFVWNHTEETLNKYIVPLLNFYPPPIERCLAYESSSNSSGYVMRNCDSVTSWTLCEFIH